MEFEKNLKTLEKMAEEMAEGRLNLAQSIESFKKGRKLIEKCRKELLEAENTVQKLVGIDEETGQAETEDFRLSGEESK